MIVRAYDDGVAFSYELDTAEGNEKTSVSITDEMSTVNIPEGAVTWSFENGGSYEDEYHRKTMEELGGTPAIPLLYQTEDLYVLFNEANLIGSDFCGSRFKTSAGSSTFELDFAREQSGAVTVQFPFTSPWRYAVAGDLGTITENTMAENLSPAPDEEKYHYSDWVEPGVASWTWLAEGETREGQENIDAIKRYIDMAAELGWKYFLWDDGWQTDPANNVMNPHAQEVIDYAAERGIGILVINVTAADSIDVKVARKGGFTIKLTKIGETEPVSTAVLEYVLGLAEDVDTDGVVNSVVEIFNDRKAAAYDILEKAEAGDPSVTQSMIDQSWSGLIEIMQYMSFKQGDMTDLQKVVDLANSLDLTKYLDEGQQKFNDALAAAEAVLEDELTEQTAIDQAWKSLLKAMSELRLKPSKDALEELIASAQSMSTEGVSEETAAVFRSALARAVNVYEDEQASGNSGSGKADGGSQTTISSGRPAVKTGDTTMSIAGSVAVMALAAAGAAAVWKKKREI